MLISILEDLASRFGGDVALIDEGRPVDYAELWGLVTGLSDDFRKQGLGPAMTVGISIKHEYRHFLSALALMRLGCRQITLPTFESAQYRERLATQARVQAQVVEHGEHALGGARTVFPHWGNIGATTGSQPGMDEDAACIFFATSGTTGKAKLIPLSQKQLYKQAENWQYPPGRDIFWRPTPIEYNNSKRQRLYNLVNLTTNVFVDPTRQDMLEIVERHRVTRLNLSSTQARHLLQNLTATGRSLPDYCQVRIGGSAVSQDLRAALVQRLTRNLHITYATSEFGSVATAGPEHHENLACTGAIHPGVTLRIVDEADSPLPARHVGHIEIQGPGMANSYHEDAVASARSFSDGWFRPGDMGYLSDEGLLFISGRADDMMSLSSINIFPSEIEVSFSGYPGLLECAAFSLKSKAFGDIPIMAVVGQEDLDLGAMLRFGKDKLGIRSPRKIFVVSAMPRNRGGKIMKDELRRLFEQQSKS